MNKFFSLGNQRIGDDLLIFFRKYFKICLVVMFYNITFAPAIEKATQVVERERKRSLRIFT